MTEDKTKSLETTLRAISPPPRPTSPTVDSVNQVNLKDSRDREGGGHKDRNAPPIAPQIMEKIFEMDGIAVMDSYHWMKDSNNPKVSKYLKDENAYAANMMKHTQHLQDTLYEEFVKRTQGISFSHTHTHTHTHTHARTHTLFLSHSHSLSFLLFLISFC
jgi:hypothetical protein